MSVRNAAALGLAALSVALLLFLWQPPAFSAEQRVIPAGNEVFFRKNVDARALTRCGWKLAGIRVERNRVVYRFERGITGTVTTVILEHPTLCELPVVGPSASFCVRPPPANLGSETALCSRAALAAAIAEGLRSNHTAFKWKRAGSSTPQESPTGPDRPEGRTPGLFSRIQNLLNFPKISVALPIMLFAMGFALLILDRRTSERIHRQPFVGTDDPGVAERIPFSIWTLFGCNVIVAFVCAVQTKFHGDDFAFLLKAVGPSELDPNLRLITTNLLFEVGVALGGHPLIFGLFNFTAFALIMFFMFRLGRSMNLSSAEALTAASIYGLNPSFVVLLQWGSGIQWLSALAATMAVLFVVDRMVCAVNVSSTRRLAYFLLAAAVLAVGVLSRSALMFILPLTLWLWCVWVRGLKVGGLKGQAALVAVFALPVFLPMSFGMSLEDNWELGYLGVDHLGSNLFGLAGQLRNPVFASAFALVVASVFWLYRSGKSCGLTAGDQDAPGQEKGQFNAFLSHVGRAIHFQVGRTDLIWIVAVFGVISSIPVLLNRVYFAGYYSLLMSYWLALLAAKILCSFTLSGASRWSVVACLLLFQVDVGQLPQILAGSPDRNVEQWSRSLSVSTPFDAEPCSILIKVQCDNDRNNRRSDRVLLQHFKYSEKGLSVNWFTPWRTSKIHFVLSDGKTLQPRREEVCMPLLTVGYCHGRPHRYQWQWDSKKAAFPLSRTHGPPAR